MPFWSDADIPGKYALIADTKNKHDIEFSSQQLPPKNRVLPKLSQRRSGSERLRCLGARCQADHVEMSRH
jgi:hypothetical protein